MNITEIIQSFEGNAESRFENAYKINKDDYYNLHSDLVIPTSLKIDVDNFRHTMEKYKNNFKNWSNNRTEMLDIRLGLPLVNLTGKYDCLEDITIGPLDYYNKNNPNFRLNETDIIIPTPVLDEDCFSCLDILKPYLIRSSILKWYKGANFFPHIDLQPPTPHLRLWGTDNPDSIKLRFQGKENNFVAAESIEAGRLYIIDTAHVHDAVCLSNIGYQFFIAVSAHGYDVLTSLKEKQNEF